MFVSANESGVGRGLLILAPPSCEAIPFDHAIDDAGKHQSLLSEAQRLRGRIYLKDGAIRRDQLAADGRHVQSADYRSWHLLTMGQDKKVSACIRYLPHRPQLSYTDLSVSCDTLRQPRDFAGRVRRAVQAEIAKADELGFSYVELGSWVVTEDLRCSTEAIRMLLMMYSLSQVLGGAIALSTATTRHSSSSILRRIGGKSLIDGDAEVGAYFDSHYDCEMEMLAFDSRYPNPRYSGWIREFRDAFHRIPVISSSESAMTNGLLALNRVHEHAYESVECDIVR